MNITAAAASGAVAALMPVLFCVLQSAILLALIATVPEAPGTSRYGRRFACLACLTITLQAGSKLARGWQETWEAEGLIRAMLPTAAVLQIYILTGLYYLERATAWEAYRVQCVPL